MHGVFSRSMVRALLSKSLNRISSKVSSLVQSDTRPLTPFIQRWRTHTLHPIVLNLIRHGHEIPFLTVQWRHEVHTHGPSRDAGPEAGVGRHVGQGSGDAGPHLPGARGLLQLILSGPQKGRRETSNPELEAIQQVCEKIQV